MAREVQDFAKDSVEDNFSEGYKLLEKIGKKKTEDAEKKPQTKPKPRTAQSFYCELCSLSCFVESQLMMHIMGNTHRERMEKRAVGSGEQNVDNLCPLYDYAKNPSRREPVIGLEFVVEFVCKTPSLAPQYFCTLCRFISRADFIFHIISWKHRYNYVKKAYPLMDPTANQVTKSLEAYLKETARTIETLDGHSGIQMRFIIASEYHEVMRPNYEIAELLLKNGTPVVNGKPSESSADAHPPDIKEPDADNPEQKVSSDNFVFYGGFWKPNQGMKQGNAPQASFPKADSVILGDFGSHPKVEKVSEPKAGQPPEIAVGNCGENPTHSAGMKQGNAPQASFPKADSVILSDFGNHPKVEKVSEPKAGQPPEVAVGSCGENVTHSAGETISEPKHKDISNVNVGLFEEHGDQPEAGYSKIPVIHTRSLPEKKNKRWLITESRAAEGLHSSLLPVSLTATPLRYPDVFSVNDFSAAAANAQYNGYVQEAHCDDERLFQTSFPCATHPGGTSGAARVLAYPAASFLASSPGFDDGPFAREGSSSAFPAPIQGDQYMLESPESERVRRNAQVRLCVTIPNGENVDDNLRYVEFGNWSREESSSFSNLKRKAAIRSDGDCEGSPWKVPTLDNEAHVKAEAECRTPHMKVTVEQLSRTLLEYKKNLKNAKILLSKEEEHSRALPPPSGYVRIRLDSDHRDSGAAEQMTPPSRPCVDSSACLLALSRNGGGGAEVEYAVNSLLSEQRNATSLPLSAQRESRPPFRILSGTQCWARGFN
ncbi:uncharacterized protein si:ch211-199g17.2 isoform X2 [Erpetoichthys calabaricus]|uniref:uncharacterized protein si:ch211-199g17.2 isoform X2 n=1 Tax=Erpetoichthys calabaricus TaxID=27687 RepID=UPI00109FF4AD|nr:uncharacterized protein si:ch211-199g17.2 isoform X2 [Erpetoichthys calabaricus]